MPRYIQLTATKPSDIKVIDTETGVDLTRMGISDLELRIDGDNGFIPKLRLTFTCPVMDVTAEEEDGAFQVALRFRDSKAMDALVARYGKDVIKQAVINAVNDHFK